MFLESFTLIDLLPLIVFIETATVSTAVKHSCTTSLLPSNKGELSMATFLLSAKIQSTETQRDREQSLCYSIHFISNKRSIWFNFKSSLPITFCQ